MPSARLLKDERASSTCPHIVLLVAICSASAPSCALFFFSSTFAFLPRHRVMTRMMRMHEGSLTSELLTWLYSLMAEAQESFFFLCNYRVWRYMTRVIFCTWGNWLWELWVILVRFWGGGVWRALEGFVRNWRGFRSKMKLRNCIELGNLEQYLLFSIILKLEGFLLSRNLWGLYWNRSELWWLFYFWIIKENGYCWKNFFLGFEPLSPDSWATWYYKYYKIVRNSWNEF